jgi:hypothetical protein
MYSASGYRVVSISIKGLGVVLQIRSRSRCMPNFSGTNGPTLFHLRTAEEKARGVKQPTRGNRHQRLKSNVLSARDAILYPNRVGGYSCSKHE